MKIKTNTVLRYNPNIIIRTECRGIKKTIVYLDK